MGGGLAEHIFHQSTELGSQAHCGQLTEEERTVDAVIGLLQVNEGCIQRGVEVLCLVDECIRQEDVIRPSFTLGNAPWKGWDSLVSCIKCINRVLRMPVNSLPKQLVIEIGL